MTEAERSADQIRSWIERLAEGDDQACTELINQTASRLTLLARRMFRDYDRLGRWVQSEDVSQNASLRLWSALRATRPTTALEFHRLAALQIRRELIDQVRRYFGPEGIGARHESNVEDDSTGSTPVPAYDLAQSTLDPAGLSRWAEFHEKVADLPEEERLVFDLVWYQGLSQAEAAEVLEVSERTLKRRWLSVRLRLSQIIDDPSGT